ncbi:MAG: hypothetical protein ABSC37_02005 [Xanthobacteraceae bacterium]|jgi:hypothetical protein
MDTSEKHVADFLAGRGYTDIVYEPDGNVPPDFLVDGRIAIEVRRLNQNFDSGPKMQGLEEVAMPLRRNIKALALSLGPPKSGMSWFVFYSFGRPLESWKILKSKIRASLIGFMNDATNEAKSWKLGRRFELEVFPATKLFRTFYVMGGHVDRESGGWLVPEMQKNLNLCIHRKNRED